MPHIHLAIFHKFGSDDHYHSDDWEEVISYISKLPPTRFHIHLPAGCNMTYRWTSLPKEESFENIAK